VFLPKGAPWLVSARLHARELGRFEGVHGDGAHEGDVDAESTMHAGAGQAHEDAELGRCLLRRGEVSSGEWLVWRGISYPLRTWRSAINTFVVAVLLLDVL
jgi:hypothetical protein